MEVQFRTRQLERCFEREAVAVRAWGPIVGQRYVERVTVIIDSPDIQTLYAQRSLDLHPLTGDRHGQYALRLTGQWRLLISISGEIVTIEEVSNHYD